MSEDKDTASAPYWKCNDCGYTLQAPQPPEACPTCHHSCEFINVTCYIPECGFQGIDPKLK
jgi:rubrerythrin